MKRTYKVLSLCILIGFTNLIFAQQNNFDIDAYKQFLQNNNDMQPSTLMNMHPAGTFSKTVQSFNNNATYLDSITEKYELTNQEKELLSKNGFMVSERLSFETFGDALKDIFHKDLPVFVSTDAILHALHYSFDGILVEVEGTTLIPTLEELLIASKDQMPQLHSTYSNDTTMLKSLLDLDYYLTTPMVLLGMNETPYYDENTERIDTVLQLIEDENTVSYSFFGEKKHPVDFSQFKPRGHYNHQTNLDMYPKLDDYFKAMIWLGRTELSLLPAGMGAKEPTTKTQRTTITATLFCEALELGNAESLLKRMDNIITLFVGEQDNITYEHLISLLDENNILFASDLTDTLILKDIQSSLLDKPFAFQRINSQIIMSDPSSPDSIVPACAFMPLGQRFIIDSYVTAQVVFDRIEFQGKKVKRMLPQTLDVLFALGNDAALQLLQPELEQWKYSSNLAAVRYLIDSYEDSFWQESIFNSWLQAIRTLNPVDNRDSLPQFMQTAAYWQQKMNTQLSSWTELRHDNLLYAKQSYTGGAVCSFPYSYVEPFPEFYDAVAKVGENLKNVIEPIEFDDTFRKDIIIQYCDSLIQVMDQLETIAAKELNNTPLSDNEKTFLRQMLRFEFSGCVEVYDGWYTQLYYNPWKEGMFMKDNLVADIHTAPTDAAGMMVGWVKHVGTGDINLGVFVAKDTEGNDIAFVGPCMSYYDYTTTNFLRLTDQEWKESYLQQATRPEFVNVYLANADGEKRPEGPTLITGINGDNNDINTNPTEFVLHNNYPNPFNPSTIITFNVPSSESGAHVLLQVFDITGALIKTLVNESVPSGSFVTKWDGKNSSGATVPSGTYIYQLKSNETTLSGKMMLLK